MAIGAIAAGVSAAASAASAAHSIASGGSKGGTNTTTTQQSNAPWQPQQPYLLNGLQDAQNIYNQDKQTGPYSGGYYSPINDLQKNTANGAYNFSQGQGNALENGLAGNASGLFNAAPQYSGNAGQIENAGITGPNSGLMGVLNDYASNPQATSLNPDLGGALNNAAVSGSNYLQKGESNLGNVAQQALANPTQQTAANAQAYENSSPVQQNVAATNQMIDQTLNQQTLPGVNRSAAVSGNMNSSRAGMETALAKENAAHEKAQADAGLYNSAFNTGLSTAAQQHAQGLSAATQADSALGWPASNSATSVGRLAQNQGQFNVQNQMGAAEQGLGTGLNYQQANAQTELNANSQLGNAAKLAAADATAAPGVASQNYSLGNTAGGLYQANQQAQLNAALQNWQMQTQYPYQNLQSYWNIAGKPLGSQTTGTQQQQMQGTAMGGLMGGISGVSSALGGLHTSGLFGSSNGLMNAVGSGPVGSAMTGSQALVSGGGGLFG